MHTLTVNNLHAAIGSRQILKGVDLEVRSGEVHAIMGPNGSGKSTLSHVLMGKPGYQDVTGSLQIDGADLLDSPTAERAHAGLFLAMQYPIEVPGVSLVDTLGEALRSRGAETAQLNAVMTAEAKRIGFDPQFLSRPLNVDLSGGEKKRNETLMMSVLNPKFAILDEIDSGLDVDALRAVSQRIQSATEESSLGVVAITHYSRLLTELKPDVIHIMVGGRIVESGGPELADELERDGYRRFAQLAADGDAAHESDSASTRARPKIIDPWGDPLAGM